MENGIIALLSFDNDSVKQKAFNLRQSRIALDLKITSNFPIISFDNDSTILVFNKTTGLTEEVEVQHFSIPQNLHLHLTTKDRRHIFFNSDLINDNKTGLKNNLTRIFSWFSGPLKNCRPLEKLKRHEAALIIMIPGVKHTDRTGVFADFFIHSSSVSPSLILAEVFQDQTCYIMADHNAALYGPTQLHFAGIFRKEPKHRVVDVFMTIRYGFYESDSDFKKLDIPFELTNN